MASDTPSIANPDEVRFVDTAEELDTVKRTNIVDRRDVDGMDQDLSVLVRVDAVDTDLLMLANEYGMDDWESAQTMDRAISDGSLLLRFEHEER